MRAPSPLTALTLGAAAVAVALAVARGVRTSRRAERELLARPTRPTSPGRVDFAALAGLPPPVERYLRRVLSDGQPVIERLELAQAGSLRSAVDSRRWMPFTARQVVAPRGPGFVWIARARLAPLLHLTVRDAYVAGHGSGRVSLPGSIPLAADADHLEIDCGALHRYLAETVWYPTALLPGAGVDWRPLDAGAARATFEDHGLSVSLDFRFGTDGLVSSLYTPARWGRFGDRYRQAGWEARVSDYAVHDGIRVPTRGEVGWFVDERWQPVWRGENRNLRFAFAD